jgi:hypothetical protein
VVSGSLRVLGAIASSATTSPSEVSGRGSLRGLVGPAELESASFPARRDALTNLALHELPDRGVGFPGFDQPLSVAGVG